MSTCNLGSTIHNLVPNFSQNSGGFLEKKVRICPSVTAKVFLILILCNFTGFEVVALWDPNNQGDELLKTIDIDYASFEDEVILNQKIGLLLIFCDPSHHAQIAVKALGIAKHVFVHPPASISPAQTQRMVQSASYYPNLTAVVGGLRCLPAAQEMRRLIDEKYLGGEGPLHCDIRLNSPSLVSAQSKYSWKCREDMGGGALNQFGYALIDLGLIYLLQQRALRVHGIFRTMQRKTSHINGMFKIFV